MHAYQHRPLGADHDRGLVEVTLDVEGAEWLASYLPANDGFTRDLRAAIAEAQAWHDTRAEGPGIVVRVAMHDKGEAT